MFDISPCRKCLQSYNSWRERRKFVLVTVNADGSVHDPDLVGRRKSDRVSNPPENILDEMDTSFFSKQKSGKRKRNQDQGQEVVEMVENKEDESQEFELDDNPSATTSSKKLKPCLWLS